MGKILYGMPRTRSFRVLWTLEEVGAEYEYHLVNLGKEEGQAQEFLRLNPGGKLPVLVDGDLVLSESAAICTHLAESHPESALIPAAATSDRARYNQWCFFVLSELEQPLWTIAKHKFALPRDYRVREVIETATFEFARAVKVLDLGLRGREYLVGDNFSVADLLATHTLMWARAAKVELGSGALETYLTRNCRRPAWVRAERVERRKEGVMV